MNEHPFRTLYTASARERDIFGEHWCGPLEFQHGEKTVVAYYNLTADGQDVSVFCVACPARFYTVTGWGSECQKPIRLTTGSGSEMAKLAHAIATALSQGMLGLEELPND